MCSEHTRGTTPPFLVEVVFKIRSEGTSKERAKHRLGEGEEGGGKRAWSICEGVQAARDREEALAREERTAGGHHLGLVSMLRTWVTSAKWMKGLGQGSDTIGYIVQKDGSGCRGSNCRPGKTDQERSRNGYYLHFIVEERQLREVK